MRRMSDSKLDWYIKLEDSWDRYIRTISAIKYRFKGDTLMHDGWSNLHRRAKLMKEEDFTLISSEALDTKTDEA